MANDYLDMLKAEAATGASPNQPANPYLDMLKEEDRQRQLMFKATTSMAVGTDPTQFNTQLRVAKYLGYPTVAAVQADPKAAERDAKIKEIDENTQNAPILRQKYTEDDFARLAHGDSSTLAKVEGWFSGAGSQLYGNAKAGTLSLLGVGATVLDSALSELGLGTSPAELAVLYKNDPAKLKQMLQESPATFLSRFARAMQAGSEDASAGVNAAARETYGDLKYATLDPNQAAYLSPVKITSDVLNSLPTTLALAASAYLTKGKSLQAYEAAIASGQTAEAALLAARTTGAATMAKVSAVSEGVIGAAQQYNSTEAEALRADLSKSPRYAQLVAQGYAPESAREVVAGEVAAQAGQIAGIVDAVTNYVGGKYIGQAISEGGSLTVRSLKAAGEESLTEFVQSMGEQFGENWATKLGIDPNTELTKGVLESAIQGLVVGAVSGGATAAAVGRLASAQESKQKAETNSQQLLEALRISEQSGLRNLNPEQFRSLVQQMADQTEGAPTEIYVDGDVLNQLAPEALAQLPQAVRDQIPQAAAIGDVVAIPMGDVLTVAPGTVLEQALVDNARIGDPRAMTRKEAQEAGAQAQEFLAQEAQRVMQQAQDQAAVEAEFAAVRDDLKTQIAATQRYSESVSDAYATGLTHFFVAYGSRTGMGTQGLYQAYRDRGFRISGQPTAQAQGQVLNDIAVLDQGDVTVTDQVDEVTGLPLNADGTVTLYHHTSAANAEKIRQSQALKSAGEPSVYLTTRAETDTGYGDTAVKVRINPELLQLDDEFPDGRRDFSVDVRRPGGVLRDAEFDQQSPAFDGTETGNTRIGDLTEIEVDGKTRPALNSNGQPIHPTQEGVRNFWRWFGDSKVVDADGRPLVVYHGSGVAFDAFDANRLGENTGYGDAEIGFHFADNRSDADFYATKAAERLGEEKGVIRPFYLSLQNPLIVGIDETDGNAGSRTQEFLDDKVEAKAYAEANGHDGVVYLYGTNVDSGYTAIAFTPTQIKSVFNRGTFDPTSANVLEQGPLGTFNPRSLELVLNPDANLSTLWHEMGHFFLEVMADISSQPDAPSQISADFDTFLKWAGTDRAQWAAWQAEYKQTGKINPDLVAIHERWAESIEQYIMEGKVPNAEMQPLMRRFSAWLLDVYKSIKKFLAGRGVGPDGNGTFQQAAFHGTPHRGIDKFSTDKIGTGEGAQAYGWGLYFASKKEVAEWYRGGLTYRDMVAKFRDAMPDDATLDDVLEWANSGDAPGDMAAVIKALANDDWLGFDYPSQALTALFKDPDTYDASQELKAAASAMQGQLYEVEIPEDSEMLLWDKPLSEQPEVVQRAVERFFEENPSHEVQRFFEGTADDSYTGKEFYTNLKQAQTNLAPPNDARAASEALAALGIKGIKYLDGTSRGAGDGSYNYVIFSGDDVQITEQFYQGGAQRAANMQLNDDIRRVMDRMLATDEQIQQANEAAGMAPNVEADAEANERLNKRSMADLKWTVKARDKAIKKLQAEAASIRKEIEEQVTLEVNQMPEVLAKEKLDALTIVPEHKVLLDQYKADRQAAIDAAQTEITDLMVAEQEAKEGTLKGLAKGQFLAKSKREIANRVDARMIEWDRANPRPMRPVNVTDMDMAIIADSYGFADVPTMLQAIDAFGNKRDVIEGMTEQRMLEEHGDLIDPRAIEQAANEAVHNEARARSLASELRTQQEMLNPRTDTGQVNAAGSKITVNALVEAAKQFGANVVARTPLKDLRSLSAKHTAAERRAAKRWQEATAKGDTQAAVKAKQDQMLNNAAAKAAIEALEEAKKITEFFKRVVKGNNEKVVEKGRDPDIVNAARAVLAAYGVETPTTKAAADYLEIVQRNDADAYSVVAPMVDAATKNAQPLQALTFEELQTLNDHIRAIWSKSKTMRTMEVDGDILDLDEVEDELFARAEEIGIPDVIPGETSAMTKGETRVRKLRELRLNLTRVEQWAEAMDGKAGGKFWRYIFLPIKAAADRVRERRVDVFRKMEELTKNVAPAIEVGLIDAPELGYTFGKGDEHNRVGMAELLPALFNVGNDSNKRKLLLGREDKINGGFWGSENADGTLNTAKWDAFIKRLTDEGVLTKAHWDYVQGVWDVLESLKPQAQEAHRKVYGRYFDEVTANQVVTPFGTYRGGYYPAQVDSNLVSDMAIKKLAEKENENMSYAFPSVGRGFTMTRQEYNRPLKLDINVAFQHIDKVILFSEMQPAAQGIGRLLKRKKLSQALERITPGIYEAMLVPWSTDAAKQIAERPVTGDGGFNRAASMLRARVGMQLMMGNTLNAAQQVSGIPAIAAKLEADGLKRGNLRKALVQWVANPKKFSEEVWQRSPYMKDRAENEVAAMADTMNEIMFNPTLLQQGERWTRKHAYFLQTWMDNRISPIAWTAAYNAWRESQPKVDTTGMTPSEVMDLEERQDRQAMLYADGLVRQTQGSQLPEDISRFERGTGFIRLFTQFAGYFNMQANTNAASAVKLAEQGGLKKNAGRGFYVVMLGLLAPIWIAEVIGLAMRGGADDEDKDGAVWDDWLRSVFGMGTFRGLVAMVPVGGQVLTSMVNRFNDNPADDKISVSPAVSFFESLGSAGYQIYRGLAGEEVNDQRLIRDVGIAAGTATGLPLTMFARPVGYAAGVADDRIEPTGPVDLTRGLVTGTASPESKQR
jgi:hypothetical protein